jgi:hypothetical protein
MLHSSTQRKVYYFKKGEGICRITSEYFDKKKKEERSKDIQVRKERNRKSSEKGEGIGQITLDARAK